MVTIAAILAALVAPANSSAARVLLLKAADTPRLAQTLVAFRERAGVPVDVIEISGTRDDTLDRALAHGAKNTVIVALGPRASDYVMRVQTSAPVVHCLAGPDALRAGLPSIPSDAPADLQAQWLARLLPKARTVGLLFDPAVNTRRVEALAAALQGAGYRTLQKPVESPAALPAALESLDGHVDALLAFPDPTVYTREASRGLLLFSFRKGIPIVGPNEAWVRQGALFAVDWDYGEIGAACAQLALTLSGAPRAGAPPRPRVAVNLRSAAMFGIRWSPELLRSVDSRHE